LESAVEWLDAPLGEDEQKGVVDEMEREDTKHMSVVGMKDGCWQSSLSSLVWSGGVFVREGNQRIKIVRNEDKIDRLRTRPTENISQTER
jgi:hypothetical protein